MANEEKQLKNGKKKLEKEKKKRDKKQAKRMKNKQNDVVNENEDDSSSGKAALVIMAIIIVALWLVIIGVLIKWDVGGFGSTVLTPVLKDVPYINKILPDTEDESDATGDAGIDTLDEALAQIKVLEQQLADAQTEDSSSQIADLEAEVTRLKSYETDQKKFEEEKAKFYEEVVYADNAPDIEEYKSYYESIEPANAEELYKEVVEQVEYDDQVEDYAATYAAMKPKQAAALMENMKDNYKLVAEILQNMSTDARAGILDAMDSSVAAQLTELMAP